MSVAKFDGARIDGTDFSGSDMGGLDEGRCFAAPVAGRARRRAVPRATREKAAAQAQKALIDMLLRKGIRVTHVLVRQHRHDKRPSVPSRHPSRHCGRRCRSSASYSRAMHEPSRPRQQRLRARIPPARHPRLRARPAQRAAAGPGRRLSTGSGPAPRARSAPPRGLHLTRFHFSLRAQCDVAPPSPCLGPTLHQPSRAPSPARSPGRSARSERWGSGDTGSGRPMTGLRDHWLRARGGEPT